MRAAILLSLSLFLLAGCSKKAGDEPAPPAAQEAEAPARDVWVDDSVKDFTRKDGFLTLFADEKGGKVYAVFPPANDDGVALRAIYAAGLTSGLGSNPVGLDRGLFDSGTPAEHDHVMGGLAHVVLLRCSCVA